ncbi:hypothetical protein [Desulfovibrio piger]
MEKRCSCKFAHVLCFFILVMFGFILAIDAPQAAQEKNQGKPCFNLTVKEFASNYDATAKSCDSEQRVNIAKQEEATTMLVMSTSNGALVSTNTEGKISSILYIGTGDGTVKSGANIITGIIFTIAAIKPEWEPSKRGDVMRKLGLLGNDGNLPKSSQTVMDGVQFTFSFSQEIGVMLGIDPLK